MKKDMWTAVQFNFQWLDQNPKRSLNDEDRVYLERYIPFSGCGLIDIRIYASRILITTSTPHYEQEKVQIKLEERLRDALKKLEIL